LAEATGGRVLAPEQAAAVFDPVPGARAATEAWPWLLTLAALLLPLDVALRRLGLGAALAELGARRGAGLRARTLSRQPQASGDEAVAQRAQPASEADAGAPAPGSGEPVVSADLLARLREARDRARDE
jgi:hypothetical protein